MEGTSRAISPRPRWPLIWLSSASLVVCMLLPQPSLAGSGWKFWKRSGSPAASENKEASTGNAAHSAQAADEPVSPNAPTVEGASSTIAIQTVAAEKQESASEPATPAQDDHKIIRLPPRPTLAAESPASTPAETELTPQVMTVPIDLASALKLAGVRNLDILIAQQRVLYTTAQQQLAAAQALPNFNIGGNYDQHTGFLQQASGNILQVQRSALYLGSGANAVAAGSVNIPGFQYNLNVGESYFNYLVSQQRSQRFMAAQRTAHNDAAFNVAMAYLQLVEAEGTLAIALKIRDEAAEIAKVTSAFAKTGQGRHADAERAAAELYVRQTDVLAATANLTSISAQLVQLLNLEHSLQLKSADVSVIPRQIVPDPIPLPELIAIGLYHRPEAAGQRASIHAAMLQLKNARLLPFSPQVIAGFSGGVFGGGSDLVASDRVPRYGAPLNQELFGNFAGRTDQDIVAYWSIRNLGLGNKALIDQATAALGVAQYEQIAVLNKIRAQVAEAYANSQSTFAQLDVLNHAVITSREAYQRDLVRTRGGEGLPIELLDSLRLSSTAQMSYLQTIISYNISQYQLYRAIGQPPADLLARPVEGAASEPPVPTPAAEAPQGMK